MTSAPRSPADAGDGLARRAPDERGSLAAAARAQEQAREDDARARREIERELVELLDGPLGDEDDAAHRARARRWRTPRTSRRSPMVAAAATGMSATSASSSATRRATSRGQRAVEARRARSPARDRAPRRAAAR